MRFHAMVELGGKTATGIAVPADVVAALGPTRRPAVRVTVGTHTYRTTIASMGGRFLVPLSAENRTAAGVAAGEDVDVDIEVDEQPREVAVPADLAAALSEDAAAQAYFDQLAYTHRKEWVRWVEDAKKPETRSARITKTVTSLRDEMSEAVGTGHAWGVGSAVANLRRVLVRTPSVDGDFEAAGWRRPDPAGLLEQHAQFVALLQDLGCQVEVCAADPGLVDAVYTHDPVITTPYGAIVLQMRKPVRASEPDQLARDLDRLGVPVLGSLTGSEYADGGDKVWFDDHTLAMGHGYRTNAAGIDRVRQLLEPYAVDVLAFDLPHFEGPSAVLHLMSVISPLANDLAAVYEPLAPVRLLEFLDSRGYERVTVDADEFATQGANILAVRPRVLVVAEGNPQIVAALRARGCEVHEFAGSELSVKGDGGPTCLTQPLWRAP